MSRIGKKIIQIPAKTEVSLSGNTLIVKGPKAELKREIPASVVVTISEGVITTTPKENAGAVWGTVVSHIENMVKGVNEPFTRKLILEGIGFKADVVGNNLNMALGFSHPINVAIPEGITVTSEKGNVTITGSDKEMVTRFASQIRAMKKPEPYKGKGFRYDDETIKRKQGKKAA